MPIYEYQCQQCQSHFERRQSVAEDPLKTCEKCGGELKKQWSLSGFQFKGEGWYVTDYAAKKAPGGDKPAAGEGKEKSSGGESTAAADTASKPPSDTSASKPPATKESGASKE